jgi:hypothetical protein
LCSHQAGPDRIKCCKGRVAEPLATFLSFPLGILILLLAVLFILLLGIPGGYPC